MAYLLTPYNKACCLTLYMANVILNVNLYIILSFSLQCRYKLLFLYSKLICWRFLNIFQTLFN